MQDLDKTTYIRPGQHHGGVGTATPPNPFGSTVNARLTIFDGVRAPFQVELQQYGKNSITFGRSQDNDIVFESKLVSRYHGEFRLVNGQWSVYNNPQSTNGVLLNGQYITQTPLNNNDCIRIDSAVEAVDIGVLILFSTGSGETWKTITLSDKPEISIGRKPGNTIVLNHVGVSSQHARIARQSDGYYLIDNNSTNGTWVNGKRVSGRVLLHQKDVITITNSRLIFSHGNLSYCTHNQGISLEARHIIKAVDGGKKVICNDVSLNINPCEMVAIIGGSGAGKSTIMNCISGYNTPTSGSVRVNGTELYENFESMKNIIGYVPQQDIVYENLTVYDMLSYTANLRLPKDMTSKEREETIMKVIAMVELTERKDTMIGRLSGGQKKRASIAVELLSDPNLFFLDEPASGLDPGTERNLMMTLRGMASKGKTVIFVTHSTLNLHLCDKVVFMGRGGNLCFCGTYQEALNFFGVQDIVDVYNMITDQPEVHKERYARMAALGPASEQKPAPAESKKEHGKSAFAQMMIMFKRNMHLMFNDRARMLLLILQSPLLAALISLVVDKNSLYVTQTGTLMIFFAIACCAFWVGIMNSIQEVCKERNILRREYLAGTRLSSYIGAKMTMLTIISAFQALLFVGTFTLLASLPEEGALFAPFAEVYIIVWLTILAASAMGLVVSAFMKNADRAMTVAPILLMPQLLFAGFGFKLPAGVDIIQNFVVTHFSLDALKGVIHYQNLKSDQILMMENMTKNPDLIKKLMSYYAEAAGLSPALVDSISAEDIANANVELPLTQTMVEESVFTQDFIIGVVALVIFVVVCAVLAGLALRRIKKDH